MRVRVGVSESLALLSHTSARLAQMRGFLLPRNEERSTGPSRTRSKGSMHSEENDETKRNHGYVPAQQSFEDSVSREAHLHVSADCGSDGSAVRNAIVFVCAAGEHSASAFLQKHCSALDLPSCVLVALLPQSPSPEGWLSDVSDSASKIAQAVSSLLHKCGLDSAQLIGHLDGAHVALHSVSHFHANASSLVMVNTLPLETIEASDAPPQECASLMLHADSECEQVYAKAAAIGLGKQNVHVFSKSMQQFVASRAEAEILLHFWSARIVHGEKQTMRCTERTLGAGVPADAVEVMHHGDGMYEPVQW